MMNLWVWSEKQFFKKSKIKKSNYRKLKYVLRSNVLPQCYVLLNHRNRSMQSTRNGLNLSKASSTHQHQQGRLCLGAPPRQQWLLQADKDYKIICKCLLTKSPLKGLPNTCQEDTCASKCFWVNSCVLCPSCVHRSCGKPWAICSSSEKSFQQEMDQLRSRDWLQPKLFSSAFSNPNWAFIDRL